ncbi:response regulator transcription factor [Gordonia sp. TBRC 11910]|uniref:Response regulator transcription factor n=1 Tax=Gordonia asplenii TaxID=2725283 RepID=A0A848KYD8_9ACTN|nr:response regulator transcription factor [Gordonia asplenii]NMO03147.1 response regulator transcription factor [Gordonia asplenii]
MGIRVALVDDYEVVVQGLASMLRSYHEEIEIVELNANTLVGKRVDIALYDSFANPQGDKDEVRWLAANPLIDKVVVYSWNVEPDMINAAIANGAHGYVAKGLPASALVSALLSVHRGDSTTHLDDTHAKVVSGDWPGREEGLTQRESEVLALITQGLSNVEVADRAGVSINSVKTYIRSCYRRIGVTTRAQAVAWGASHGFLPDRIRISRDGIDDPTVG